MVPSPSLKMRALWSKFDCLKGKHGLKNCFQTENWRTCFENQSERNVKRGKIRQKNSVQKLALAYPAYVFNSIFSSNWPNPRSLATSFGQSAWLHWRKNKNLMKQTWKFKTNWRSSESLSNRKLKNSFLEIKREKCKTIKKTKWQKRVFEKLALVQVIIMNERAPTRQIRVRANEYNTKSSNALQKNL